MTAQPPPRRTDPRRTDIVLERLTALHPKLIDLGLDRTERLLGALDRPDLKLPPVIHVAGTNGKGSTIAFMRAIAEAAGLSVHTYTSPHLVRFNERIVLNGIEIDEDALLAILEECEAANGGEPITFFEITTAAAFLAYSRSPADLLLLETGLGGRFDSTNVLAEPAVTVITPVSIDHTQFLGDTIAQIAFEKAGILKPGVPCIVGPQTDDALRVIEKRADEIDAPLLIAGIDWSVAAQGARAFVYRDTEGEIVLPAPALGGAHQLDNAGAAIAAMRCWNSPHFGLEDLAAGMSGVHWPGRLQRLSGGALQSLLPDGWELWLDGGHNPAAGAALAEIVSGWQERPVVVICGMQENKDVSGFLAPLAPIVARLTAVALPKSAPGHPPADIVAAAAGLGMEAAMAPSLEDALRAVSGQPGRVLVCGSLYLAGEVLALNAG
jgi:dihydrofolate synthase / folylpolyglutamate synthase